MKFKKMLAASIAKVAMEMAKKSHGTASRYGTYEPKEPEMLKKFVK